MLESIPSSRGGLLCKVLHHDRFELGEGCNPHLFLTGVLVLNRLPKRTRHEISLLQTDVRRYYCRHHPNPTHQVLRESFIDFDHILGNVLHNRGQAVLRVAHVVLQSGSLERGKP